MNKPLSLAAGLTACAALILGVSFSFGRGRLEEAAYQRAKVCNDAYWKCMGKCQDMGALRGLCENGCLSDLRKCRDKANLPRTTDVDPGSRPGATAAPKHVIDGSKVTGATITASATPHRRMQGFDERLNAQKTSVTPEKSSPTPTPRSKPTASVSKKSSK